MELSKQSTAVAGETLTRREMVVLAYLAANKTNREIAEQESLSLGTVKWYVNQILGKLGAADRQEAVRQARELGLLAEPVAKPLSNLPIQLTSLIGREKEITQVLGLVSANRLVTITGAGGSGKTRLGLEAARQALPSFIDGVWMVDLASQENPEMVALEIVAALGLKGQNNLPAAADAGRAAQEQKTAHPAR